MDNKDKCELCGARAAAYTCPTCRVHYCGLTCFKAPPHGTCAEGFYHRQVEEEMQGMSAPDGSRERMEDMLRRLEQGDAEHREDLEQLEDMEELGSASDATDSDDDADLEDRLRGVDLDDADAVWARLTASERDQFRELLKEDDVTSVLPAYQPWWVQDDTTQDRKIAEMTEDEHKQMLDRWKQEAKREESKRSEPKIGEREGKIYLIQEAKNSEEETKSKVKLTDVNKSANVLTCEKRFKTGVTDIFYMKNVHSAKISNQSGTTIKCQTKSQNGDSTKSSNSTNNKSEPQPRTKPVKPKNPPRTLNPPAQKEAISVPQSIKAQYSGGAYPSPRPVWSLPALCPSAPSPLLPHHLTNALLCYATLSRRYRGDLMSEALEVSESLLGLCTALSGDPRSLTSTDTAVAAVAAAALTLLQCSPAPVRDVIALLQLPSVARGFFAHLALADLTRVLEKALLDVSKPKENKPTEGSFLSAFPCSQQKVPIVLATKKTLNAAIRKLEFYLSYLNSSYFKQVDLTQDLAMLLLDRD